MLTIEPADLDFGLVWEDPGFVWKVSVYNRSDRPVKIAEFVPSCPALVIEPASLTVPAGGSAEIRLRIDLTKSSAGCCGCDSKQTTTDSSSQGQD